MAHAQPYTPKQGDIVHLDFDPAAGREMKGPHYALIVSPLPFNRSGLALACPVSQGAADQTRTYGLVVTLIGSGTHTQGAVHLQHLKSLDWRSRKATYKESLPDSLIEDVLARLATLVSRQS